MQKIFCSILCLLLLVTACKEHTAPDIPPRKRACLHFINLHPDYTAIDLETNSFETNGNLIDNLAYLDTWPHGGYANLLVTQNSDTNWISYRILDYTTGAEIIPITPFDLFIDKSATLILAKDAAGLPIVIKTLDSFDDDTDSTGNIRLMNFDETLTSVTMISSDTSVFTPNIGSLNYTGYKAFLTGKKDIYFINNAIPDTITMLNKEILLHRNYSAYIVKEVSTGNHLVFWEEMADVCK